LGRRAGFSRNGALALFQKRARNFIAVEVGQ
jgi:hypothetical protein